MCLFLGWRLLRVRRIIRQLIDAAGRGEPLWLERDDSLTRGYQLDQLVRRYNDLVAENAAISGTEQDYHELTQKVLGNLREAVVMVDEENRIVSANAAFQELISLAPPLQGKRLDGCMRGTPFMEFLQEIRSARVSRRAEMQVQVRNSTLWLEVSAAPLQDRAGSVGTFTLFVFHNVTRQKKLETMRTEFVANVSHELRTPVTIIKGFAQTLLEDEAELSDGEKQRFLQKIRTHSERLHSLLQDLLLLTRLESTELLLQKEQFPLSSFLRELADNFRPNLDETQTLQLELADGNDQIFVDPLRLSQVVNNLLDNSARHARGFTEIRIRTELKPDCVVLTIIDNGPGIPDEDLPHIFQRFYRVEKGRSRESGGTGLGLSIVKHIVGQHGGEIRARSKRGQGTEIEITLPRQEPPAER